MKPIKMFGVLFLGIRLFAPFLAWGQTPSATETPPSTSLTKTSKEVLVLTPTPSYSGWLMEFKDQLFNEDLKGRLAHEYHVRIGQYLLLDHPLNTPNDRRNRIVFNAYSGTYVNLRNEEKAYGEFFQRLIVDGFVKAVLDRPSLREAQQWHNRVQDATRISINFDAPPPPPPPTPPPPPPAATDAQGGAQDATLSPTAPEPLAPLPMVMRRKRPPPPPRHFASNWDVATYHFFVAYSGPEGSFHIADNIPFSRVGTVFELRPVIYYNFPIPSPYSLSLSFNTSNHSHGASVGRELVPGVSASISINGNIPRGENIAKEYRSHFSFSFAF